MVPRKRTLGCRSGGARNGPKLPGSGEGDDEIRERYLRDGYVVRDVLTLEEVRALRAEIAAVCRGDRGEVDGLKPLPADTPDEEAFGSILNIRPHNNGRDT